MKGLVHSQQRLEQDRKVVHAEQILFPLFAPYSKLEAADTEHLHESDQEEVQHQISWSNLHRHHGPGSGIERSHNCLASHVVCHFAEHCSLPWQLLGKHEQGLSPLLNGTC